MHVVPYVDAPPYDAPGHLGMAMRRLQGREAGPSNSVWIGVSRVEPGGGTTLSASDVEKFYVCLQGEVVMTARDANQENSTVMRPLDSCRIAPHEARQITNRSTSEALLLLVMPQPLSR
ncbi:MAG: cupin domain-containing protein [Chitinophagaceae bacterium]|nr:cupin domain-containing protein [Rubrivivax sp.]